MRLIPRIGKTNWEAYTGMRLDLFPKNEIFPKTECCFSCFANGGSKSTFRRTLMQEMWACMQIWKQQTSKMHSCIHRIFLNHACINKNACIDKYTCIHAFALLFMHKVFFIFSWIWFFFDRAFALEGNNWLISSTHLEI